MKKSIAIVSILLMTILPALMGAAQAGAVEYKSTYKRTDVSYPNSAFRLQTTAAAPTATFQSTSAYSSQWSNETTESLLNNDGSVNSGAYLSSGPNRAKTDILPPNPTPDPNDTGNVPLGEGILALMLMAGGYAWTRRRNGSL